jgi:predicted nuclease of predicted toxin-antitoxin system
MKVRFPLDENLSPRLKAALLRFNPAIDVVHVGEPGAPQLGTPDPDVLRYLEISERVLVTSNRKSMPAPR